MVRLTVRGLLTAAKILRNFTAVGLGDMTSHMTGIVSLLLIDNELVSQSDSKNYCDCLLRDCPVLLVCIERRRERYVIITSIASLSRKVSPLCDKILWKIAPNPQSRSRFP
jgi:hypothetical protein